MFCLANLGLILCKSLSNIDGSICKDCLKESPSSSRNYLPQCDSNDGSEILNHLAQASPTTSEVVAPPILKIWLWVMFLSGLLHVFFVFHFGVDSTTNPRQLFSIQILPRLWLWKKGMVMLAIVALAWWLLMQHRTDVVEKPRHRKVRRPYAVRTLYILQNTQSWWSKQYFVTLWERKVCRNYIVKTLHTPQILHLPRCRCQWRQPSKSPPVLPLNGELPELYRHRSYLWTERERTILNSGPVHSHRSSVPFRSASFHSKHERPINRLLFKRLFLLSI